MYQLYDSKISRHHDMLWLPFEALKVLPHTFILGTGAYMQDYSVGSMCSCTLAKRTTYYLILKRKVAQGMEWKETSRPCANLQWPIGRWTSGKLLHIRWAAWALMSRVEAHLLPSLTTQRRASSQDCLPKTSVDTEIQSHIEFYCFQEFQTSWLSNIHADSKLPKKRFKMRAPRHRC